MGHPENMGSRLHARMATSLTREAGPMSGRMSSTPTAVVAAFVLWVFTLVEDTGVLDIESVFETGGSD